MSIALRDSITSLPQSPTLAANELAAVKRASGQAIFHMGFGQSPFPVHPRLRDALRNAGHLNQYEQVAGLSDLRAAALKTLAAQMEIDPGDYDLVVAPGSKLLLYALQMAVAGDLLLPRPSWVSYAPQAAMLKDRVVWFDTNLSDAGFKIDPDTLTNAIIHARARGLNPRKLIINSPNNPTGLVMPYSNHRDIAEVCREQGVFVISDEIYRRVSFNHPPPSFAAALPGQTAVTTGLSKHLSLGGWRVGIGLIPRAVSGLNDAMTAIASETWSSVATPIQWASMQAYQSHEWLSEFVESCTQIHAAVANSAATILRRGGISCPLPQGAFYLWPDFEKFSKQLDKAGIRTSEQLAAKLLERYNVLTLPGSGFGATRGELTLRLSVCDYNGGAALEHVRSGSGQVDVEQIAPAVLHGANMIIKMVRDL